ncbi:hypothetical protein [Halococcus agarilyticus]|uniref:hypothetical protein n=1 Tax=Halococcus agarilyticus TaxID=1232219 RepID=UPI0006780E17|nr:hypothetical protein [Halococcus agarilyticus]
MWLDEFRYRTAWNAEANERRYDAPADPWALVHVDPSEVERLNVVSLLWGLGRVRDGDWDRPANCRRIDDTPIHEGLTQRFGDERDWEETAYYEHAVGRIEDNGDHKGVESEAELVEEYLPALDELYADLCDEGYRPNRGVVYDGPEDADYIHDLEPMVLVGRDGEIIWTEGFHRLVLADLAGIPTIPVYVLRRHDAWQRVRDALARTTPDERPSELATHADHPDVSELVP